MIAQWCIVSPLFCKCVCIIVILMRIIFVQVKMISLPNLHFEVFFYHVDYKSYTMLN